MNENRDPTLPASLSTDAAQRARSPSVFCLLNIKVHFVPTTVLVRASAVARVRGGLVDESAARPTGRREMVRGFRVVRVGFALAGETVVVHGPPEGAIRQAGLSNERCNSGWGLEPESWTLETWFLRI